MFWLGELEGCRTTSPLKVVYWGNLPNITLFHWYGGEILWDARKHDNIYLHLYLLLCHYVTSILHDTAQCNPIGTQSTLFSRINCKANLLLFATFGRGDIEATSDDMLIRVWSICWKAHRCPWKVGDHVLVGSSVNWQLGCYIMAACVHLQNFEQGHDFCMIFLQHLLAFAAVSSMTSRVLRLVEDRIKICPDSRLRSETGMRESMVQTWAGGHDKSAWNLHRLHEHNLVGKGFSKIGLWGWRVLGLEFQFLDVSWRAFVSLCPFWGQAKMIGILALWRLFIPWRRNGTWDSRFAQSLRVRRQTQGGKVKLDPINPLLIHMGVSKIRVPQNGWFIVESPIKIHDLGVSLFLETPILNHIDMPWILRSALKVAKKPSRGERSRRGMTEGMTGWPDGKRWGFPGAPK